MLRVKFVTKNIDPHHPNHQLLMDRSADFANFNKAMDFIRSLRSQLQNEVLVFNPEVSEVG